MGTMCRRSHAFAGQCWRCEKWQLAGVLAPCTAPSAVSGLPSLPLQQPGHHSSGAAQPLQPVGDGCCFLPRGPHPKCAWPASGPHQRSSHPGDAGQEGPVTVSEVRGLPPEVQGTSHSYPKVQGTAEAPWVTHASVLVTPLHPSLWCLSKEATPEQRPKRLIHKGSST